MPASRRPSYLFGGFRLDPLERVLFHEDQPVPVTPKAFETLVVLVERHGHLVTKDELFRSVWPDAFVEENNLAQNISTLRRVLGELSGGAQFIETVPKRGYRFTASVVEQPAVERSGSDPPAGVPGDGDGSPRDATAVRPGRRAALWLIAGAFPLLLIIASGARPWLAGSGDSGTAAPVSDRAHPDGITRIAVLPFENLGPPDDEAFVRGMHEEISSRLARLRGLAVTSSTTVLQYDRTGKSVRRIVQDLGVEYLLEGSVRWARTGDGGQVRITSKLIRAADDSVAWTQQHDAPLSELFAAQGAIAYQITQALEVALEAPERRRMLARPTADPEAYLAYLRGIAAYQQGSTDTTNQTQARTNLEAAVTRDPGFALAWSWLARVYAWQYRTGAERRQDVRAAAHRAAETAMALDPTLVESRLALAQLYLFDGGYDAAMRELDSAAAGMPHSPEVLRMVANLEQARGRWREALEAYTRAFDLDPASTSDLLAIHHLHLRQFSEARRYIEIATLANRLSAAVPKAWIHFSEGGDLAAARRVLEAALDARTPADARVRGLLARLEWFDGRYDRALTLIEGMDAAGAWLPAALRFPAPLAAGQVYDSMGRRADAVRNYAAAMAQLQERLRTSPDDYQLHAALALAAAGLGRSSDALRHGARAVQLQPMARDAVQGPLYVYLLAQIEARLGQHDAAFATLDELFSSPGFYTEQWVLRDPWFATLRTQSGFVDHLRRWSAQKGHVLLAKDAVDTPSSAGR